VVDAIRAGSAPMVIRLKGAEGSLPVALEEKIEILILLSTDADEGLRRKAWQTLVNWNPAELEQLLSDAETPWSVIDYLAIYVAPARPHLVEALLKNPGIPTDLAEWVKQSQPIATTAPPPPPAPAPEESPDDKDLKKEGEKRQTLVQRINAMTPVEKIKTALTGNQEERLALIKDSNKLVSRAVLGSPKLSDAEVEAFASMKNVTEDVLRLITMNRRFMKSYSVARSLINNPRSPLDVTLPLVSRLNERDLKGLSMNRNVPETLRSMATKFIKQKQDAQKVKIPSGKH
jgi:hypothetical protein